MNKTYNELISLSTFEERFEYLKTTNRVGDFTFGCDRYLNQILYTSVEWKNIRRQVIIRDNGCDLAFPGFEIHSLIYVHHINPITREQILNRDSCIFDLNNLVCTSKNTHDAIHYGNKETLNSIVVERTKNDTCPWKV